MASEIIKKQVYITGKWTCEVCFSILLRGAMAFHLE